MATATVQYVVTVSNPSQSPAQNDHRGVNLDIDYIDQNGVTQRITGDSLPSGAAGWNISFTGTVGNQYHVAARDIQNFGIVTTTMNKNGSQVATSNNATNPNIKAGVTGTI